MTRPRICTFLLSISIAIVMLIASHRSVSGQTIDVWFGTSTPRGGDSQGIYHAALQSKTGKLTRPTLAATCRDPGFLALHPSGTVLYATGSPDTDGATVSAYRVSGKPGNAKLEFIGAADTGDGGAAQVSTNHAGTLLFSAQYGSGCTSMYELGEDGAIKRLVEYKKHAELLPQAGSGVVPNRQDAPHAHWTGTSPDDRFLFVPDLGMDRVVIWKIDAAIPALTHHGFGVCPPGSGPRHMKFNADGSKIYVLNELALSITVFEYDAPQGAMTPVQTIATLSEKVKAKETFNSASEIRIHPSGRFLYAANRGHDSISAFRIDAGGRLSSIEVEPIRGGWPRNFNLSPDGRWLVAAGQESNTATVFSIDADSGELTFIRETQSVPTPICVVFGQR